jgi:peroxiredoxin Q/BCP
MKYILTAALTMAITIIGSAQDSTQLNLNDKVDIFNGLDDNGVNWSSETVKTDFLVVYFYPAAMTGGCTKQACAYRDDKVNFDKLGVTVIGVSGDEVKNLKHFKDSYQLNFKLISDTNGEISKKFKVPTTDGGSINREIEGENYLLVRGITTPRWTFVLDKDRKIIYKNAEVNATEDSKKVKELINSFIKK